MEIWLHKLQETFIATGYYKTMLQGFANTMIITVGALCISIIIGIIISVTRFFAEDTPILKPFSWICDFYVTAVRGIPVVVLLLIFYFIILVSSDGMIVAVITFGINSGAYMAEIIRSGINAIDKGQMEAGRSLGMSKLLTMRTVILPQALRVILPTIGNEFVALLKETAVAGYVAVVDLTRAGNLVRNNTYDAVNPLLSVAVTYLILVVVFTSLLSKLERKLAETLK